MSYRFFSTTTEQLRREGERRARLAELAAVRAARVPQGRPPLQPEDKSVARRLQRRARPASTGENLAAKSLPGAPPAAAIAYSRLAFGPAAGDIADFNGLAGDDASRLQLWLDQQLDPAAIDDSAAEARIAQAGFVTLDKTLEQLWADHIVPPNLDWQLRQLPFEETELATFLRAVHSRRQLLEVMVDFWHNHFNVYGYEYPWLATWPHTDRDAIRAHALGNFRQMLEAVAKTPSMLLYLDNAVNSFEDANENYGRELLELHSLGSASYFGNISPAQVPVGPQGKPAGYVEDDVVTAARCLTGWTLRNRSWDPDFGNTGAFFYYDDWHDHAAKSFLGVSLPANQPAMKDGQDLFDILAQHPATAQHLALKIARRLLGDFPPQSVVDNAAAVFAAQHAAPDQIAQVIRAVVLSPEFRSTWADKVKRPFEIAVSAMRGAGIDLPFEVDEPATGWFRWVYDATGQPLFGWHPPNGYPDVKPAWNSTSPRVMSWRLANTLIQIDDDNGSYYFDPLAATPPGARSARALVEFWTDRILGRPAEAAEENDLILFMAQGHNPDFDLPLTTDPDTYDRLRALVALIFQSPSFLWR